MCPSYRILNLRTLRTTFGFLLLLPFLISVTGCKRVIDLDGNYILTSVNSDLNMGIDSQPQSNEVIQSGIEEPIVESSIWRFVPVGDGHYVILSKASGFALTVKPMANDNDAELKLTELTYDDDQLFRVVESYLNPNAQYAIINKGSNKAIAVKDASTRLGGKINAQTFRFLDHQKWIVSGHNPNLPERKLISAEDAWDVFAEAGEPYVGPTYQQNFNQHHIGPASPLDPRAVAPGTMIPGRVKVNGQPLVEYFPGKLPFIAVCIHNKVSITPQMRRDYPVGWRSCTGNCDSLKTSISFRDGKQSVAVGDSGSGSLCQLTVEYLEKITGKRPHMIVPHWPKGLMDMNRRPRDKVIQVSPPLRQHPDLIATWDDFMSFVREARDLAYQEWGGGLQIGFHGQVSRSARNHFGTGITSNTVDVPKSVMNNPESKQFKTIMRSSRFKYSLLQRKLSPWEAYKGEYSLGQGVAVRGIPTFPSATMKDQKGPFWSTGGSFELTSVSQKFQDKKIEGRPYPDHHPEHFDSVQLESYSNFMRGNRLKAYAAQLGEAIYDNLVHNLGFNIPRIREGDGAMTGEELSHITTTAADCKGSPIKSTTSGRVDDHFHLPQACLQFCKDTPGCKYVSMFVDPSPDPDNKRYKYTRKCFAYDQCTIESKSDYNVYRLMP